MELVMVLAMIGIGLGMALTVSIRAKDSAANKQAIAQILQLQTRLDEFAMTRNRPANSLGEVGAAGMLDPWGVPYTYQPFLTQEDVWNRARRDRFLVPVNSMYDLYSFGKDGVTHRDLNKPDSLDDIVRANDGAFVGLGLNF